MTKILAILLALASLAGLVWTVRTGGADGSWLLLVVPLVILAVIVLVNVSRGLPPFTDNSGGH
jgi:hypothetical protein